MFFNRSESLSRAQIVAELQQEILETMFIIVIDAFGTDDDMKKNTDFLCDGKIVAARYRTLKDWDRYCIQGGELTIRKARNSGSKTEWEKMMSGHGDYLFYCGLSEDLSQVVGWVLIDLSVLREMIAGGKSGKYDLSIPIAKQVSDDDGSVVYFQPIPWREWGQIRPDLIRESKFSW